MSPLTGPLGRNERGPAGSERSGTSWQSDPGPVAAALAMQSQCVPGLADRPEPPRLSAWISSGCERGQPQDSHVDK